MEWPIGRNSIHLQDRDESHETKDRETKDRETKDRGETTIAIVKNRSQCRDVQSIRL